MSVNYWTLSDIWCVVMFEICSGTWAQFKFSIFITVFFKVISDWTFILNLWRFWLWIERSWYVFSSGNCWISDSSINFLLIHITSRPNYLISKCFDKMISSWRFAIFPVDSTSWGLCHSFTWLINIILSRSKSTTIIGKSCHLCHENTFYRSIRLLNNIIVII
jgi:hypothetical protein